MIYLVGGAPRIGKSTISNLLREKLGVSVVSTDTMSHALDKAFPQLGIRKGGWDTIPELFYPFLREFVGMTEYDNYDYCIEGDAFFPVHADKLRTEFGVKPVFLGTSNTTLEAIKKYGVENSWVSRLPNDEQVDLARWIVEKSGMFKRECEKLKIPYFDLVGDGVARYQEAYEYLAKHE